jgi:hypothetical protein
MFVTRCRFRCRSRSLCRCRCLCRCSAHLHVPAKIIFSRARAHVHTQNGMAQALEEMRELQSGKGGADTSIGALPSHPLFLCFLLSLSLPLSFPPFFPLLAIPPRPTPFFVSVCALRPASPWAWQQTCTKACTKACLVSLPWSASSLQVCPVSFQDAPRLSVETTRANSLGCQLQQTVRRQRHAKPFLSLWKAVPNSSFAEAPLERLRLLRCLYRGRPKAETRNLIHDRGHVHARARHRRAFGESLRSLAP